MRRIHNRGKVLVNCLMKLSRHHISVSWLDQLKTKSFFSRIPYQGPEARSTILLLLLLLTPPPPTQLSHPSLALPRSLCGPTRVTMLCPPSAAVNCQILRAHRLCWCLIACRPRALSLSVTDPISLWLWQIVGYFDIAYYCHLLYRCLGGSGRIAVSSPRSNSCEEKMLVSTIPVPKSRVYASFLPLVKVIW
jgi:hypothetical protein